MQKRYSHRRIAIWGVFLFAMLLSSPLSAKKPPWAGGPGNPGDYPPVSAPEPSTLTLAAMAAAGAFGYAVGRRKKPPAKPSARNRKQRR